MISAQFWFNTAPLKRKVLCRRVLQSQTIYILTDMLCSQQLPLWYCLSVRKKECAISGYDFFFSFKYIKLSFLSVLCAAASQTPSQTESRRHPWNALLVAVYFNLTNLIYSASAQIANELHLGYVMGQLLWELERRSSAPAPNLVTFSRKPSHGYMDNCIWNKKK